MVALPRVSLATLKSRHWVRGPHLARTPRRACPGSVLCRAVGVDVGGLRAPRTYEHRCSIASCVSTSQPSSRPCSGTASSSRWARGSSGVSFYGGSGDWPFWPALAVGGGRVWLTSRPARWSWLSWRTSDCLRLRRRSRGRGVPASILQEWQWLGPGPTARATSRERRGAARTTCARGGGRARSRGCGIGLTWPGLRSRGRRWRRSALRMLRTMQRRASPGGTAGSRRQGYHARSIVDEPAPRHGRSIRWDRPRAASRPHASRRRPSHDRSRRTPDSQHRRCFLRRRW